MANKNESEQQAAPGCLKREAGGLKSSLFTRLHKTS